MILIISSLKICLSILDMGNCQNKEEIIEPNSDIKKVDTKLTQETIDEIEESISNFNNNFYTNFVIR